MNADSGASLSDAALGHTTRYAKQLAVSLHAKHYSEVAHWEPLPDLMGLLTQIDNMTCGLVRPCVAPNIEIKGAPFEREKMRDDSKKDDTERPEHWLHTKPDSAFCSCECERLQRTIKVLIAIGFVTECKAEQAYQIAITE